MSKFVHDADDEDGAKAIAMPRVFSDNSRAKSASIQYLLIFLPCFLPSQKNIMIRAAFYLLSANTFSMV